jgi:hypothetical protein
MDEEALRARAADKLRRGELPKSVETRVWAGPGLGMPCSLCENPILTDDVEYELQHTAGEALRAYRYHRRCHAAWQLERGRH